MSSAEKVRFGDFFSTLLMKIQNVFGFNFLISNQVKTIIF